MSILCQINCFRKCVKLCNKPSTSLLLSDITILLTIRLFENYFSKNEMQLYFRPCRHLLLNQPERENNNSEIIYLIYGSKANAVQFSYQRTCQIVSRHESYIVDVFFYKTTDFIRTCSKIVEKYKHSQSKFERKLFNVDKIFSL